MRRITLITTGGTIEKTYDEQTGELSNRRTIVRRMLRRLRLEDTNISILELMSKDSLHMTEADRAAMVRAVSELNGGTLDERPHGIVILHGTDTLELTGESVLTRIADLYVPVVLTGAMRPFEMRRSDALQNLTEAIFASGLLPPGVYFAGHGRVLAFPGVHKDKQKLTFHGGRPVIAAPTRDKPPDSPLRSAT